MKINAVRLGFPLPAERTEEHQRLAEARRRYSLRILSFFCWFQVALFAVYALLHGWPAAKTIAWFRWLGVTVTLGIWLAMMAFIVGGETRLAKMGRGLRPACSWRGPFSSGKLIATSGLVWGAAYLTGLVLLLVFFRR